MPCIVGVTLHVPCVPHRGRLGRAAYLYTGVKDGKSSRDVVTVKRQTRKIEGVPCVAVHDRLYLRGHLAERTTDWYSQDSRGNIWYFGENTAELDAKGHVTSTEGTWMAGVNGGKAGIFMPGHPHVGNAHVDRIAAPPQALESHQSLTAQEAGPACPRQPQ